MTSERAKAATAGVVFFVVLSFLGSWFVSAALRVFALNVQPGSLGTRLFTTSLLYAVTMGWQPLLATWMVRRFIDPPDRLDLGLRPSRRVFSVGATVAVFVLVGAATGVAWAAVATGVLDASTLSGYAEREVLSDPSVGGAVGLSLAFVGTLLLVWMQAFAEEVGFRGYFLPRAMELFGRWPGLVLHGAVWGLWYAPVLFFSTYGPLSPIGSVTRSLGFVVTCMLLGTLFGWLRLASKSLVPVVLANTTLTLFAGLPYFVHGIDAGLRSAIFGPPGWLVLIVTIGALAGSRWRLAVRVPEPMVLQPGARETALLRISLLLDRAGRGRDDHMLN